MISMPMGFHLESIESGNNMICHLSSELTTEQQKNSTLAYQLAQEKAMTLQLESLLEKLKPEIPHIWRPVCPIDERSDEIIGSYTRRERWEKICRYKEKQMKYRDKVKISREFRGRSEVAKEKPRVNGKFVKSNDLDD